VSRWLLDPFDQSCIKIRVGMPEQLAAAIRIAIDKRSKAIEDAGIQPQRFPRSECTARHEPTPKEAGAAA
jgi:hypothetical protein